MGNNVFKVQLRKHYSDNSIISDSDRKLNLNSYNLKLYNAEDDGDIESKITNMYNITYFGKLWFSSKKPAIPLEFIFDTSSSWLWASAEGCNDCPFNEYIPSTQYYG